MSEFTEYLNQILKDRNLNSAQAARQCGLDGAVLFRWQCGNSLPRNWRRLQILADKLRLTSYETMTLEGAYRRALLGETHSGSFDEILKTLKTLAEKREEYQRGQEDVFYMPSACNWDAMPMFQMLNHKLEIMQCVQGALAMLARQNEGELSLKLHSLPEWLIVQLKQLENRSDRPVEMFICDDGRETSFYAAEPKVTRMRQIVDLMIVKNPVGIYFYKALDEQGQMKQNWLVSDFFVIQFLSDLSKGMMTRDKEWIAFFKESARLLKKKSKQFCKYNKAVLDFLDREDQLVGIQISTVDFMPCLSVGLTEEIVREGILHNLPEREKVIEGILRYPNTAARMKRACFCFQREGLYKFMDYGVIDLFPYKVYRPLPMKQRCDVLRNVIALLEEGSAFRYHLLKDDFPDMQGICVEQRKSEGDRLHIYFSFEEGQKEEILILDPDIRREYVRFFQYLKESRFVYSRDETLAFLKETLLEYQAIG